MGHATARAPIEKPNALNAPLFRHLVSQLEAPRHWLILDLGAASTELLTLLGRFRCCVEIADVVDDGHGLDGLNDPEADAGALRAAAEALLPARREAPIDIVLCWDLLNYLRPKGVSALMQAIAARSGRGAMAHGLIVYRDSTMPREPGRFVPSEDLKLVNRKRRPDEIKAPRYSPEDLSRAVAPFQIDRGMLLANGMQEFLFRLPLS
jgi:hypothetical protein